MPENHVLDARPPSWTEHPLFRMAMGYAKAAVALDTGRQYDAAIPKYTRAAEALLDFLQVNKNPKLQQLCVEKLQEYVHRAKFLASKGRPVSQVITVHEPPASCRGCRFYDKYRDDCRSVMWHLMQEHRAEDLHCPSHERGTGLYCPGGKCYGCTSGVGCDD